MEVMGYMMVESQNILTKSKEKRLIEEYKAIKSRKHRIPTVYDFDSDQKQDIKDLFGNLKAFCIQMGDTPKHGSSWIPDDIYFEEIADLTDYLGYPPHSEDYSRAASITNRLGGKWHDVLKAAGIKATFASPTIKVSKEEVIYKAKKAYEQANMGYLPSWNDLKSSGVPVASIYLYWPTMDDFRVELKVPSKKEWQWKQRENKLKQTAINILSSSSDISIDKLQKSSNLRHSQIVHIIQQAGGLKKYILVIKNSN